MSWKLKITNKNPQATAQRTTFFGVSQLNEKSKKDEYNTYFCHYLFN